MLSSSRQGRHGLEATWGQYDEVQKRDIFGIFVFISFCRKDPKEETEQDDDNDGTGVHIETPVEIPGQVMDEDSLNIFDEVSSDSDEEDDGSLFGQYLSSEDEDA